MSQRLHQSEEQVFGAKPGAEAGSARPAAPAPGEAEAAAAAEMGPGSPGDEEQQARRVSRLEQVSRGAAWVGIFIGIAVLLGWMFDIEFLKRTFPGRPEARVNTVKANTGLCFLLLGIGLRLRHQPFRSSRLAGWLASGCASIVLAISAVVCIEWITGWGTRLDNLLVRETPESAAPFVPGRMSIVTASSFLLLGLGMLWLSHERLHRTWKISELFGCAAMVIALGGVIDFFLTVAGGETGIAPVTVLTLSILGLGLMLARPDQGLALIVTGTTGGYLSRKLLPAAVLFPLLISVLCALGQRAGMYSDTIEAILTGLSMAGVFVAMILWAAQAIHKLELERRGAEQALHWQQYLLSTVLEQLPVGIWISDANGRILHGNEEGRRIWGGSEHFSIEQYRERKGWWADTGKRLTPSDWALVRAVEKGESSREEIIDIECFDHSRKTILNCGAPIHDENGKLMGGVCAMLDISKRKQAEDALKARTEELARSNSELEQFAYVASHDLQEPLRAVSGCVQLLESKLRNNLDERSRELMRHATEGASRMQALIQDLLAFSRVGTRGLPFEPVDCERLLTNTLSVLSVSIKEHDAKVTHTPLPTIVCDPSQMGQLFQNLLANAIKFHADRPPEVNVSAERNPGAWEFIFRDNGIGMDPAYSERIFGVFQRLHTRREYPGTGIGLAICKKIVERHGGRIWVHSALGLGAEFHFTIPDHNGDNL